MGYLVNGKNTVSQEERLRRIYAPNNSATALTCITSLTSIGSSSGTKQRHGELQPRGDEEELLFGSFRDASGVPLQDRPIRANLSRTSAGGSEYMDDFDPEGSSDYKPRSGGGVSGGGGGDSSNSSSSLQRSAAGTEEDEGVEPEIFGLRLENVDFDEQNLFDGFKPLFDYPARPPEDAAKRLEMKEDFDSLEIGKKAKMQVEMEPAMDLLL